MENLKAFDENVELLCQRGLLKKEENGTFSAIENLEEQQLLLQQRLEEQQRAQQLEQQVNQNPPPQMDPERQRPNQQLIEVQNPFQQNTKPATPRSSQIPATGSKPMSRRDAANANKKGGKGGDNNHEMK